MRFRGNKKSRGRLLDSCFFVLLAHQLAQAFYLLVGWDGAATVGARRLFPREFYPLFYRWRGVFAAHAVVGIVSHQAGLLPSVVMAGVVASDNRAHLPPYELMKELMTTESYLAHEQLVEFVGGFQFFGFSSSAASAGAGSSFGSTSGSLKNLALSSITAT